MFLSCPHEYKGLDDPDVLHLSHLPNLSRDLEQNENEIHLQSACLVDGAGSWGSLLFEFSPQDVKLTSM